VEVLKIAKSLLASKCLASRHWKMDKTVEPETSAHANFGHAIDHRAHKLANRQVMPDQWWCRNSPIVTTKLTLDLQTVNAQGSAIDLKPFRVDESSREQLRCCRFRLASPNVSANIQDVTPVKWLNESEPWDHFVSNILWLKLRPWCRQRKGSLDESAQKLKIANAEWNENSRKCFASESVVVNTDSQDPFE
jgi:hypothetical protein